MTHISEIIDEILVEWAYRVHDGMPNPKNTLHIVQLRESMEELNIPNNVIYKVIDNIINEEDIVKNKESGNTYAVKNHNPKTQDLVKKDASPEDIKKVKKDDDGEEKTKDDKQKSMVGSSEQQQQKTKIDKGVKQNLDFIV